MVRPTVRNPIRPGTRLIDGNNTTTPACFSVDGGNTKLADFGQTSDPSDFLNSGVQGANDPFNEYYIGSSSQVLTTVDKELLDVLGFHTVSPVTTVIEAFGSTNLVEVGDNFYLYGNISGVWSRAEILPDITSGYGLHSILSFYFTTVSQTPGEAMPASAFFVNVICLPESADRCSGRHCSCWIQFADGGHGTA